jgi:predicted amidohydrolase
MSNESLPSQSLRVASVQMESAPGEKEANFGKIEMFASRAAAEGAKLVVFPECVITGYWFIRNLSVKQLTSLAEEVPNGPSVERLAQLARQHNLAMGAGLIERSESDLYNTYVVALPNGTIHRHRKLHAFEHDAIRSGTEYTVFELGDGWRAGVLICYDCNIIENTRLNALAGADILIAPHQTGGVRSKDPNLMGLIDRRLWENRFNDPDSIEREFRGDKGRGWLLRWLPSRAHDNGMFVIFSNGVGVDDDEIRTGNAMILDPYGRILAETWKAEDAMVITELDPRLLTHATGRKWMRSRRPELYHPLAVRTGRESDARHMKFEE